MDARQQAIGLRVARQRFQVLGVQRHGGIPIRPMGVAGKLLAQPGQRHHGSLLVAAMEEAQNLFLLRIGVEEAGQGRLPRHKALLLRVHDVSGKSEGLVAVAGVARELPEFHRGQNAGRSHHHFLALRRRLFQRRHRESPVGFGQLAAVLGAVGIVGAKDAGTDRLRCGRQEVVIRVVGSNT